MRGWVLVLAFGLDFEDGIDRVIGPFPTMAAAEAWGNQHHPIFNEAPRWSVYRVEVPK